MKNNIIIFIIIITSFAFAEKQKGDLVFRTGLLSLGNVDVPGHVGAYALNQAENVFHFVPEPDGYNEEHGINWGLFNDLFRHYSDERYLGTKTLDNGYQIDRDLMLEEMELICYEEIYNNATSYDTYHCNQKGKWENGQFIYMMDCVGFTEYLYELQGVDLVDESNMWWMTPNDQYNSSILHFVEDPAPAYGEIIFNSEIFIIPSQPVTGSWYDTKVVVKEIAGKDYSGTLTYSLQELDTNGNDIGYPNETIYSVSCYSNTTSTLVVSDIQYYVSNFRVTITIDDTGESISKVYNIIEQTPTISINPISHTLQWNSSIISSSISQTSSSIVASYQVVEYPNWVTITEGGSGSAPRTIKMNVDEYLTGTLRSGLIKIYSSNAIFSDGSHYNNISISQSAPEQNTTVTGSINTSGTYRSQDQIITEGPTEIDPNCTINFITGQKITLKAGFHVKPNSPNYFKAVIEGDKKIKEDINLSKSF
ncbi:MAG: hypothetical protein JXR48_17380 [Candidatus Delongbacteria bacterium]|nr:hypothetical protein [Candidatus Delongbacteria bacterium]MBN2836732.1 hypothetical protein [Candidatus Delongbacteria bacterium]